MPRADAARRARRCCPDAAPSSFPAPHRRSVRNRSSRSSSCASLSQRSASLSRPTSCSATSARRPSGSHIAIASAAGRQARSSRSSSAAAALRRSATAAISGGPCVSRWLASERASSSAATSAQRSQSSTTGAMSMPAPTPSRRATSGAVTSCRAWRCAVASMVRAVRTSAAPARSAITWSRACTRHWYVSTPAVSADRAALILRVRVHIERLLEQCSHLIRSARHRCHEAVQPPHAPRATRPWRH